jgi:DNA-binding response OmpR family regulator
MPPIVVIDDSRDELFFVTRNLARAGVRNAILPFDDAVAALDFLKGICRDVNLPGRVAPCLLILDIKMPGADGFDVLKWARKEPAFTGVPIIMHSSLEAPLYRKVAADLGADGFLRKPVSTEQWLTFIAKLNLAALVVNGAGAAAITGMMSLIKSPQTRPVTGIARRAGQAAAHH